MRAKKEFVDIDGIKLNKQLLARWTPLALECYSRRCNCDGCDLFPHEVLESKCLIKYYVRAYFLLGIMPETSRYYHPQDEQ